MAEHLCIAQVPLFNHLPIEAQQEIMNLTHHHIYKKNELVFQPGDENLYIIASGSIKVYQLSISGKEHISYVYSKRVIMKAKNSSSICQTIPSLDKL